MCSESTEQFLQVPQMILIFTFFQNLWCSPWAVKSDLNLHPISNQVCNVG